MTLIGSSVFVKRTSSHFLGVHSVKQWKRETVCAVHCDVNCFDSGSTAMWLVDPEWNTEQQPSGTMSHSTPDKTPEGVEEEEKVEGWRRGRGGAYKNISARKSSHCFKMSVLGLSHTSYTVLYSIFSILLKIHAGPSWTSLPVYTCRRWRVMSYESGSSQGSSDLFIRNLPKLKIKLCLK